ncbi:hypothetical protein WJX72_000252 [[Myrmecia] bisecta]|uniref:EamA domain-containing protein n=1 Tax=[Myrmecia] bisecta TaxID=41462 RepID=A0AAW1PN58_9CHLO
MGCASLAVPSLILFGTINSLLSKIVYELKGPGLHDEHYFRKPWATTACMFLAMALCLPISWVAQWNKRRQAGGTENQEPLLPKAQGKDKKGIRHYALLTVPMLFDLAATVLMSVGLLFVTASVYQMLRGAEMLFAGLFSVVFLHRPLNRLHYMGLLLCVAGISAVGASSLLGQGASAGDSGQGGVVLGMGLIVLSQAVQAAQVTVEDYCMQSLDFDPLSVVGYEGLFGSIVMLAVALPVVQYLPGEDGNGVHEDSLDTIHMVTHSPAIAIALGINILALTVFNIAGMFTTEDVGAAARTVLESMRTLFVWLAALAIYYVLRKPDLGEPWTKYSYLQAVGFATLVAGTLVYSRADEKLEKEEEAAESRPARRMGVIKATRSMWMFHPRPTHFRTAAVAAQAAAAFMEAGQRRSHADLRRAEG